MSAELKPDSRIDMKIDAETKLPAEQQRIVLSKRQYDEFVRACENSADWPLSDKLLAVGRQMDFADKNHKPSR